MTAIGMIRRTVNDFIDETLSRVPEPMAEHLGNAQKEFLKAFQALLDEQARWIDRHLSSARERRLKRRAARPAPPEGGGRRERAQRPA
ncbi:MAG: hypothetical protein HY347_04020 [candidate division NC10 bacterium]|nr:hypothetical protein [candidate division NC10 bacterium]